MLGPEYTSYWCRMRNLFVGLVLALILSNVFVGVAVIWSVWKR